ncbi:SRPBCC family protein [Candidatus Berkelbacteria bacterium]|nr:SRPBCC family protein [Candidatus Berkelbacteria bacterium]
MKKISHEVTVGRPPEEVMGYIANVENHPAFINALKSVSNLSGDATRVGTTWDWTFVMTGVELQGSAKTVASEPGQLFSFQTEGGVASTFRYTAVPQEDGTQLTLEVEYELPETVLAKIADSAAIERYNDDEATKAVENLQTILGASA